MIDPYEILHYARKAKYEARKNGERGDTPLAIMGGCMVFIGASMILKSMGRGR